MRSFVYKHVAVSPCHVCQCVPCVPSRLDRVYDSIIYYMILYNSKNKKTKNLHFAISTPKRKYMAVKVNICQRCLTQFTNRTVSNISCHGTAVRHLVWHVSGLWLVLSGRATGVKGSWSSKVLAPSQEEEEENLFLQYKPTYSNHMTKTSGAARISKDYRTGHLMTNTALWFVHDYGAL